ncbi:hypothetical protein K2173_000590 [Erythroxylum novogranatense]|uniref:BHLH domain-containing protein n=1 Tax=Erythroxylum novogranatense TaxID=1862640 RepID=A0AAV8S7L8_9ROSI|nr:hypothetical protein K2173_000590 [Erythroxylum novogranatense]
MESEFFLTAGIPPPTLQFEPTSISSMPPWHSLSSAMEIQANEFNCSTEHSPDLFYNPNWEKSTDPTLQFDSALSSIVSSPAGSNSNMSNDSFMIRELIGKLGNINSSEFSPHSRPMLATSYVTNGNNSTNTSCYSTPLNSPPKVNLQAMNQFSKENMNFSSLENSLPLNSSVAEFTADPGFAERAARFSCFGTRSFNGRTRQFSLNNGDLCNSLTGNGKLPRVSSSPSLKTLGSQKAVKNSSSQDRSDRVNCSQEESSVSDHVPQREASLKVSIELNSRKRKSVSKGKAKEPATATLTIHPTKETAINDDSSSKRSKTNENVKTDEEAKGSGDENQPKTSSKPPEPQPPKDYIHVRARRGQATDSHSLAERVRREKISERMKLLQDLVPGCNKITGKALMLDEIINYVQSLQRQVEFLSMKLASVNTRLDFNMDPLAPNDKYHSNSPLPNPVFPLDSSVSAIFAHQHHQNLAPHTNISSGKVTSCDPGLSNMPLPPLGGLNQSFPQFCEDDLQTFVQMGFCQNPKIDTTTPQSQSFTGSNQVPHTKIEI